MGLRTMSNLQSLWMYIRKALFLEHGRIETSVCRIFRGNDLITDRKKWNGNLTVVEIRTATERKSDGQKSSERRFYVSSFHGSARRLSTIARMHWAIESMHWDLDRNLRQDFIRRNSASPPETLTRYRGWYWQYFRYGKVKGKSSPTRLRERPNLSENFPWTLPQ